MSRPASSVVPSPHSSQAQVILGVLSSRVLGLVREVLQAFVAGTGVAADVLAFAFRAPNLIQNLLGEQALSAAFIPIYSRFLGEGLDVEARRFAGAALGILSLTAAALALGGVVLARLLVTVLAPGFAEDPERFDTAVAAVRLVFPMTAVLVLSAWCLAVLNSHRRFFVPYFAPVLWNLSVVGALLWLATSAGRAGDFRRVVLVVCAGALLGAVLQLVVQLPSTLRLVGGLDARPSLEAPGIRPALRAFGPAVLGRGVVQLSGWLDLFLASWLATGALAALSYAQRLHALPLALFGTAFAVVELPELSRLRGEHAESERRLAGSFAAAVFLTAPAAIGLVGFGLPIVQAVYERGRFGADAAWLVYAVLAAYACGLIPSVASRLMQNLFLAAGDTRTPAVIALGRVLLAAAVGGATMLWLDRFAVADLVGQPRGATNPVRAGAVGLAVGSALGAWLELWALRRVLARRRQASSLPWKRLLWAVGLSLLAAIPTAVVWWLARSLPAVVLAPALVAVFAGVYLSVALWRGLPEARSLVGQLRTLFTTKPR